jgi:hypothetical protein
MSPLQWPRWQVDNLEPLGWVGGPIILLDSRHLEIQGPAHPFQVVGESFDSSWVMPSFRGALLVRLVIVGTIVIIVPLIALFLFNALSLSVSNFNPVVCISAADDIVQVTVVSPMPWAVLLRWSDAAGRVPTRTLPVLKLMTLVSVFTVVGGGRFRIQRLLTTRAPEGSDLQTCQL